MFVMESFFGKEFFVGNRAKLRTLFSGTAPIVITANGLLQRSADTTFTFHQDSNFWYLTGLDEPDLILVMDKDKEYVIRPKQDDVKIMFDGRSSVQNIRDRSGIETVLDDIVGWKQLEARLKKVKHVATLAPPLAYMQHFDFYTNPARANLSAKIKDCNPSIELLDLRQHLTMMRVIKQPPEILAMQKAIAITITSVKKLQRKLNTFTSEQAVAAALTYDFLKNGAVHAFEPIIASGLNAATIHHTNLNKCIEPGEMVLFDVGAEVEHYAADISRTYFTATPTKRQREVYQAVSEIQDFAFSCLKPGVIPKKYEAEVRQLTGEKLRELGLIKTIDDDSIRQYSPHLTSHSLGLDVHDVSDYEQPLAAGMVWTVEPGIYIPKEGIGVRIEDDVLITVKGYKNLTNSLAKTLR